VPTILIIDDQPSIREYLAALLGSGGHRLLQAADGARGSLSPGRNCPTWSLLDIVLPIVDGYEFVRQLRADPASASVPVIFFTAHYKEREAQALAQACGVFRVLTKPCEREVILGAVDAALGLAPLPVLLWRRNSSATICAC